MYHLGKRIHTHRKLWKRLSWFILLALTVGGFYALYNLRITPEQTLRNSPPLNKGYELSTSKKVIVDKPLLKLELPEGWKEGSSQTTTTSPTYSFRSPAADAQILDIYVDAIPATLAINKAIVIEASADGVIHESVSDNCTTFTEASKRNPQTGSAPAKWQGRDFYCDMANTQRAVVGAVSMDGVNYFNAVGPKGGTHKVFITFTDNNVSPKYEVFYDLLSSLHFK